MKMTFELVGDLVVEGTGYYNPFHSDILDQYQVDIDFVKWNGTDIKPVLEITGGMDDIEEAAARHFAAIMQEESDLLTA